MSVGAHLATCDLCVSDGGTVLWADARCRVVRVGGDEGRAFPGFCRVIWRAHVAESSDLDAGERVHLMHVVDACERAIRATVSPHKINIASLGNVVPHLHWHVIPRWTDDSHFPSPIWAAARRDVPTTRLTPGDDILRAKLIAILGEPVAD